MARILNVKVSNCLDCPAHREDYGDWEYRGEATCKLTHQAIGPADCLNEQGSVAGAFPKFCPLKEE